MGSISDLSYIYLDVDDDDDDDDDDNVDVDDGDQLVQYKSTDSILLLDKLYYYFLLYSQNAII